LTNGRPEIRLVPGITRRTSLYFPQCDLLRSKPVSCGKYSTAAAHNPGKSTLPAILSRIESDRISPRWTNRHDKTSLTGSLIGNQCPYRTFSHGWAFRPYIDNNAAAIPDYSERRRYAEPISTAFVESTVNLVVGKRFAKKQQMQWSKAGAHLLLQTRAQTLDGTLRETFRKWYPAMAANDAQMPAAAA
jgi:hypothetical protein